MNEYDSEVAHPGNGINTSKTTALRANLAIRHRQAPWRDKDFAGLMPYSK